MFPFRRNRKGVSGLIGLGFRADGIGVARVLRPQGAPPMLDVCTFEPVGGVAGAQALARLSRRHHFERTPCSIVVDPTTYSLLLVEAPQVPPEELRAAVRWRIQDLIDFHVDDAVIDVFDVPVQKTAGRARMMYVVAAQVPAVRENAELAQEARLNLSVIDIAELAQRNIAAQLPEDVGGAALLYLAGATGLITLTRRSTLYLARRFEIAGETSPDAPLRFDDEEPGPEADSAPAWLDNLVVEVQRSLDYYESTFSQPPITGLVVAPLEQPVPGLTERLAEQLGVSVRLLDLNGVVDCAEPLDLEIQARCFPAIGAALRMEERTL